MRQDERLGADVEQVYHLWQVDKGHKIPLGEPKLMTSFSKSLESRRQSLALGAYRAREHYTNNSTANGEQMPDFDEVVGERDIRFGADWKRKKELREHIKEPDIHPDADATWKHGK